MSAETLQAVEQMHWPDEHVAWQGVVDADEGMSVPFGVHVFVFHTEEQLRAACGDAEASAHSATFDEPDDANIGALVMLSAENLELSLVAHEVAHIALFHHGKDVGRTVAKRWLAHHPESVAEMIGNLTALIWFLIPGADDEDAHSITEPCACNPDMTAKGDHWIARHNDVEEARGKKKTLTDAWVCELCHTEHPTPSIARDCRLRCETTHG